MSKWGQEWIETVHKVFGKYWASNWQVIGIWQVFGNIFPLLLKDEYIFVAIFCVIGK